MNLSIFLETKSSIKIWFSEYKSGSSHDANLRDKFWPGPEFEHGSPTLGSGTLTN